MKYLEGLNSEQKKAVLHTDGPLLIIAGAGAGKTKTLTHRILHLIADGVPAESILGITFTNKAAQEMGERVRDLLITYKKENPEKKITGTPFLGTFHSLGIKILREHSTKMGLPRHFGIFDRDDSKRAVRQAEKTLGVDPKQFEPGKILSIISREKGEMRTPEEYRKRANHSYLSQTVVAIWPEYEKILIKEKSLDFDDLLSKTARLLKEDKAVRDHYRKVWRHVHIDEYQDTNTAQYEIARELVGQERNICVVGDIDQNIYSWRGANIGNIIRFEKDYPGTQVVTLEENYRSTQTILTAANRIIEKNVMRREKNLFTKNGEGEKISLYGAFDENDEARYLAHKAAELIASGVEPAEIAVLYRANFQSRALEEAFLEHEVPYQLLGTRFFERKEVKDVLSFVRASLNPANSVDLERIINIPPRGIGAVTLQKILNGQEEFLPAGMKEKINRFRTILGKIRTEAEKLKPSAFLQFVIKESGIEAMLKTEGEEGEERLENIRELVTLSTKYNSYPALEGIEKLLEDAALATDQDSLLQQKNGVKLMTVHASKGLEFDYVCIAGLEDNLFPHRRLSELTLTKEESEEERRLFYVALTRARKKVFLTYASMRTIFGSSQVNAPSEFISDIEDDLIDNENDGMDGDEPRRKIEYL